MDRKMKKFPHLRTYEEKAPVWNGNTCRSRLQPVYDNGREKSHTNTTLIEEVTLSCAVRWSVART